MIGDQTRLEQSGIEDIVIARETAKETRVRRARDSRLVSQNLETKFRKIHGLPNKADVSTQKTEAKPAA